MLRIAEVVPIVAVAVVVLDEVDVGAILHLDLANLAVEPLFRRGPPFQIGKKKSSDTAGLQRKSTIQINFFVGRSSLKMYNC